MFALVFHVTPNIYGALSWDTTAIRRSAWIGDKEVSAVFRFHNGGRSVITITSAVASCNCTTLTISENIIPPNVDGQIRAKMVLENSIGHQTKTITVNFGDPASKPIVLTFDVEIMNPVSCSQRILTWKSEEPSLEKYTDISVGSSARIENIGCAFDKSHIAVRCECLKSGRIYRIWCVPIHMANLAADDLLCTVELVGKSIVQMPIYVSVTK